jgi:FAD/FMN-containing dehydrogenase
VTSISTSDFAPGAALDLQSLRNRLEGSLVTAGDPDYDEVRQVRNYLFDRKPWVIVRAANAADVVQAVRFARLHQLPLAVRSGGHSVAGLSMIDGALVVDLSQMKGIHIDPEARTARVQPGVTSGEFAGPAHAYGLALTTGDTSTVGFGGLVTGGGIGLMVRKYGLTIDNLLSVEVVTAAGRLIKASPTQHSDLFWAIRGGGGNFGIITEFTFKLAPVGSIVGGALVLPATKETIRGYLDYVAKAPDELTTITDVMLAPPAPFIPDDVVGTPVMFIMAAFCGDPDKADAAYAPLRALAEPVADLISQMPYPEIYQFSEAAAQLHGAEIRSFFSNDISDGDIEGILDALANAPTPFCWVQLRGLGGAMARVAPGETAFAHRDKDYMVLIIGLWTEKGDDSSQQKAWAERTYGDINGSADGVYVNFIGVEEDARVKSAYPPATYARLAEVKREYDPNNIFQFNKNIRPVAR